MKLAKRMDSIVPYVPGEQPQDKKYIKLNTNENPYPPCPGIKKYLKKLDYSDLRLYPDPLIKNLRQTIADFHGVNINNVFVGNGSDEVLSFAFYAFFDSEKPLIYPEFTYSFYPVYADYYNITAEVVKMNPDFSVNLNDYITKGKYSTIIPNPNAPTGRYVSLPEIEKFLSKYSKENPVILDEAYIDFGGETAIPLTTKFNNLIIIRTLSKSASLAGMRIGYAIGDEKLITAITNVKDSFNSYSVNRVSQECARIAFEEWNYYEKVNGKIVKTRDRFSKFLNDQNWEVLPSKSNFVFARNHDLGGIELYTKLRKNGILVRHFKTKGIENYVRISIGTEKEINRLISVISQGL